MHTQHKKALSIVLLTSLLLQSCGGNPLLGAYRHPVQEEQDPKRIHTTQSLTAQSPSQSQDSLAATSKDACVPKITPTSTNTLAVASTLAPSTEVPPVPSKPSHEQARRPTSLPAWHTSLQEKIKTLAKTHPQKATRLSQVMLGGYRHTKLQQEALQVLGMQPPHASLLPGLSGGMRQAFSSSRTLRSLRTLGRSIGSVTKQSPPLRSLVAARSFSMEPMPLMSLQHSALLPTSPYTQQRGLHSVNLAPLALLGLASLLDDTHSSAQAEEGKELEAALQAVQKNDPKTTHIDLRRVSLTSSQLQALEQALAHNHVLGYIQWGEVPTDQAAQALKEQINEKLAQNILRYNYHPTPHTQICLTKHIYGNPRQGALTWSREALKGFDVQQQQALKAATQGWHIPHYRDDSARTGFYSVLYVNETTQQAVLCFQGTKAGLGDLWRSGSDLQEDIDGVLATNITTQQALTFEVTQQAVVYAKQHGLHLSITGHSLGGFLAELAVFFCHRDFKYAQVQGTVFDSPGSLEWLERNGKTNVEDPAHQLSIAHLPITSYLSAPNLVNSCNGHPGTVYRLYPTLKAEGWTARLSGFRGKGLITATEGHLFNALLPCFDPATGHPYECARVADWPSLAKDNVDMIRSKQTHVTGRLLGGFAGTSRSLVAALKHLLTHGIDQRQYWATLRSLDEGFREREGAEALGAQVTFLQHYQGHYRPSTLAHNQDVLRLTASKGIPGVDDSLRTLHEHRTQLAGIQGLDPVQRTVLQTLMESYTVEPQNVEGTEQLVLHTSTSASAPATLRRQMKRALEVFPDQQLVQTLKQMEIRGNRAASSPQLLSHISQTQPKHYVRRDEAHRQLAEQLEAKGVCVLTGHGGAGKSTLAAEYARQQRAAGKIVYWFSAETPDKLRTGLEQMAREVGVDYQGLAHECKNDPTTYFRRLSRLTYQQLHGQPILLVLDNVEEASKPLIASNLSDRPQDVQVLLTTRDASELARHEVGRLQVEAFVPEEGKAYVRGRLEQMHRSADEAVVDALVSEIGLIPQKLKLAMSTLEAHPIISPSAYLARLRAAKQGLLEAGSHFIVPEVQLGLEQLTPEAQALLRYCAYLDADYIPTTLLSALLGQDLWALDTLVNMLGRLSLAEVVYRGSEATGLRVHREVQGSCRAYTAWKEKDGVTSSMLSKLWSGQSRQQQERKIYTKIVELLEAQTKASTTRMQSEWYAPHVARIISEGRAVVGASEAMARLLVWLGHHKSQVHYDLRGSLSCHEQALQMRTAIHRGRAHEELADSLSIVGGVYSQLGNHKEALRLKKEALAMRVRLPENAENKKYKAVVLNSIGELYVHLGKDHEEALRYAEEGLKLRRALLGNQHQDTARSINTLASILEQQGKYEAALPLKEEALAIRTNVAREGKHLDDKAHSLNNLGALLLKLDRVEEGVAHLREGLELRKTVYGLDKDHRYVAMSMSSLGIALTRQGRCEEGLYYAREALAMLERIYPGQDHPDKVPCWNNIGVSLAQLGATEEGLEACHKALSLLQRLFRAPEAPLEEAVHPKLACAYNNLGSIYARRGETVRARTYYSKARSQLETLFTERAVHPHLAKVRDNLAQLEERRNAEARKAPYTLLLF